MSKKKNKDSIPVFPRELVIVGKTYKVRLAHLEDAVGKTDFGERTIYLSEDIDDQDEIDATILHECMHVAIHYSGLDSILGEDKEEAVCTAVELLSHLYELKGL